MGGRNASGYLSTVERAAGIGAFVPVSGVSLAAPRAGQTSYVLGSVVYLFGGANASGPIDTIEAANITFDSFSSWYALGTFAPVAGLTLASRARVRRARTS